MHSISKKIKEVQSDGMRLAALRVDTKDLLTIEGSLYGGPLLLPTGKGVVASVAAEMLDAGTKKLSKAAFRDVLAEKGISLSFSASGERLYFSISALPEDMETALSLLVECLTSPKFDEKELELTRRRMLGALDDVKTDTRTQAGIALLQMLYPKNHPNYAESLTDTEKALRKVTKQDLLAHQRTYAREGLMLAVVGDVDPEHALTTAKKAFETLPKQRVQVSKSKALPLAGLPGVKRVPIKDKANIDCYFGRALPIDESHEDYYPLLVLTSMLGGRGLSTGHLMRTIRERDGLTYGIYGTLAGFEDGASGFFRIWATFAPAVFDKAENRVREEIATFLKKGLTKEALATKKKEIEGSYQVGLGTSRGLATTIHANLRKGRNLSFIEEYLKIIEGVTPADLTRVKQYLDPKGLFLAAAGSFSD